MPSRHAHRRTQADKRSKLAQRLYAPNVDLEALTAEGLSHAYGLSVPKCRAELNAARQRRAMSDLQRLGQEFEAQVSPRGE